MSDKELLYSMLDREIDNLMSGSPLLVVFSSTAKKYVHSCIDPYLSFFMGEDEELETDMASTFVEQEFKRKIESFKKNFIQNREGEDK